MAATSESSYTDDSEDGLSQEGDVENEENRNEDEGEVGLEEPRLIDSVEMFVGVRFETLSADEVWRYHFSNLEIAYAFFNEYAKYRGFSLRKHKTGRSKKNDILWKSYVCSRQGTRDEKFINNPNRIREPRCNTRCDCLAQFQVHIVAGSSRWYVTLFNDDHNHELLVDKFIGRLPSHRTMTDGVISQMNEIRDAGISTPLIYRSFARQSAGYGNIGFDQKQMYNKQQKQRGLLGGDANAAIDHLRDLVSSDPKMYWKYVTDDEGRMHHLFWCDGDCVADYEVFGEALAFDATYGRNKYKCPVVVFSGVNHHKQTVVFACAVVSDETAETYTWMLEQLLLAMGGKHPKAVITDGDKSMKKAIARVFPEAHHILCAWHLLRLAKKHGGWSNLRHGFRKCMFGDYEEEEFEEKWRAMVVRYDVGNIAWVQDIYTMKEMWATAYMRGMFFAGLRTTSRCEGLHTQIGKYVGSRDSMYQFIKHFQGCLSYMRDKEVEADLKSVMGHPQMQTRVPSLEMFVARIYTKDVFFMFRDRLEDLACVNVVESRTCPSSVIYTVKKYTNVESRCEWFVSYYENSEEWRCSCKGMECFLIPCVHILAVIVELGIHEIPSSLIAKRWCKNAKEDVERRDHIGNPSIRSHRCTRFAALQHIFRRLSSLACRSPEDFNEVREKAYHEIDRLLSTVPSEGVSRPSMGNTRSMAGPSGPSVGPSCFSAGASTSAAPCNVQEYVRDHVRVRAKGCGSSSHGRGRKSNTIHRCTLCRQIGHNIRKCPNSRDKAPVDCMFSSDKDNEGDFSVEATDSESE